MEYYAHVLNIAIPLFLVLSLFEKWYGWHKGRDTGNSIDMISSFSSGITNVTKSVLGLSVSIISYEWLLKHIAIYHISSNWISVTVIFILLDFKGYWVHRWQHKINILWNQHVVHHSSEEYNLACALRQSISSFVDYFTFFLLPAALLGVPTQVIAIVAPVHLFLQFWYHTQQINKMGFLEHIIVTPSHHRVHHAINPIYMDKNLSQIFIFWDKLFGTFQQELASEVPVYGITRPARTWNPIKINFQHLCLLISDAWRTKSWKDKARIWFMPTGWRPADMLQRFPVYKIESLEKMHKYGSPLSSIFQTWIWIQIILLLGLLYYFFAHIGHIPYPYIFIYGFFIYLSVYSMTELMDRNPYAMYWEAGKSIFSLVLMWRLGDWFGISTYGNWINTLLLCYFCISPFIYFSLLKREAKS